MPKTMVGSRRKILRKNTPKLNFEQREKGKTALKMMFYFDNRAFYHVFSTV
jgi:hypothetical protein